MADEAPSIETPYHLHFFHTHTGERLDIVYRHGVNTMLMRWCGSIGFYAITGRAMFTTTIRGYLMFCMI